MKKKLICKTPLLFTLLIAIIMTQCKSPSAPKETATATDTTAVLAPDTLATVEPEKKAEEPAPEAVAKKAPLTLIFTNLANPEAAISVGVYGTNNKFPDPKDQLKVYKFKPHGLKLTAKITDLPFGTYAIAAYQDLKDAGKISKNLIGIPTDPYVFSNNFKPTIKAPNFNDCRFEYDDKTNTITMNMIR